MNGIVKPACACSSRFTAPLRPRICWKATAPTKGGMTSGSLLIARASMKPLSTLNRPVLKTVDVETKEETVSFKERTDVTAVPASGVVAETMVALVLATELLRKFGGDSVEELVRNHDAYVASLG